LTPEQLLEDLPLQCLNSSDEKCPLCAGAFRVSLSKIRCSPGKGTFDVLQCENCGLGMTDPMPSDLASYYENYHGGRHGATVQHCIQRRLSLVSKTTRARNPGMILDIGCGDGSFLLEAQRNGWVVLGTELNPHAARQAGLDVVTDISEIPETTVFDCITLWHSLEHLRDPLGTLNTVRRHLSPTGVLLIAVPDYDGMQARLFGRNWLHLDIPRHLYHYCGSSLPALLTATGFRLAHRWHQEFEYDLIGWSQSALNYLLPTPNVFMNLLMGRSASCGVAETIANGIGGVLLTGLALPLTALGSLLRRGGTVTVAAHRSDVNWMAVWRAEMPETS
jgi:SAM-dependent methyltransferase